MAKVGPTEDIAAHVERIGRVGYTIVDNAIDADTRLELLEDLARIEAALHIKPAGNSFEGSATTRVYNLLAHGPLWQAVPVQREVLAIVDGVLDAECLISSLSSIAIAAGETPQPIHADDQLHQMAKPHAPTVCNSMWALTDFTAANGATRLVPGSHLFDHNPPYQPEVETIPAEMVAGSVLVWHGSLWHGGGANSTDETRVGIAMNYCAGWIRQQENQQLGLPIELVTQFAPRLQELCGFGTYSGLIGHIEKQSPAARLLGAPPVGNIWDA